MSAPRLSLGTLAGLPADIARPAYDVSRLPVGIVHLGLGAFFRAHGIWVTDLAISQAGEDAAPWGVAGVSLRSPATRDALARQDGLYTVLERHGGGAQARVVGAVRNLLVAPENPRAVLKAMARPEVRIVTLTITEKGYGLDPATGELDRTRPDIARDLAQPEVPASALGFIARALAMRRAAGIPPFTLLPCDNLHANGRTLRRLLLAFADALDPALARFVEAEVATPSTMVDRIVPATADADRAEVAACLGVEDAWPVVTEPFWQWVIEDDFPTGRPAWEAFGAQMTQDVTPFESMKLRLLNGAHSSLAYLGFLAGRETVADVMTDPVLAGFVTRLMDEITPTVPPPPGTDIPGYARALRERFANPALGHRTTQIAMDGSQKLPPRLLGTIADRLAAGLPIPHLALGVAGWMAYVAGRDAADRRWQVQDPLADDVARLADDAFADPEAYGRQLFGLRSVFGDALPREARFTDPVLSFLRTLLTQGPQAAIDQSVRG